MTLRAAAGRRIESDRGQDGAGLANRVSYYDWQHLVFGDLTLRVFDAS